MTYLLVVAFGMYKIYIFNISRRFITRTFPTFCPLLGNDLKQESIIFFIFFSNIFLVHLIECQFIYPSHQRPYWPLLTRLSFQSHCDYQRSFLEYHFLILILAKTIISPCVTFFRQFFYSKMGAHKFFLEKIIASQIVLSSLSPNVLTENRTDHYRRSQVLREGKSRLSDPFFGYFW